MAISSNCTIIASYMPSDRPGTDDNRPGFERRRRAPERRRPVRTEDSEAAGSERRDGS